MPEKPVDRFRRWLAEAENADIDLPRAMALATVDSEGCPSVRYVLLKEVDDRGFCFCTNRSSQKAKEIKQNPKASIVFYWHELDRQIRVDGRLNTIRRQKIETFWNDRPRESQLASLTSIQSAPLENRSDLLNHYYELTREYEGREIPYPSTWVCFRLEPDRIEFWTRGEPRLHHRELFVKDEANWTQQLLQP